ncbi:MAG: DVUA0089 family protein [Pseudomonadales bacterium]
MLQKSMASFCMMACVTFFSSAAAAGNFSFTGSFNQDDEIQLINFVLTAPTTVTLRSYSYGGGTQADGNIVVAGGFDPVLAVFDFQGDFVVQQEDAPIGTVTPDPNGNEWDVYLQLALPAGEYFLAITQYDNLTEGNFPGGNFSNGFDRQGTGNFTGTVFNCSNLMFCDFDDNNRTSQWAFDILGADLASTSTIVVPTNVPFLPIWAMGALALALVGIRRAR